MTQSGQLITLPGTFGQRGVARDVTKPRLTIAARIYMVGTCLVAFLVLLQASTFTVSDPAALALFMVLSGLAQLFPIRFQKNASVSMSMGIALAAILILGPTSAVWVKLSSGVVHYLNQVRPKKRPLYHSLVTFSTLVIAVRVAGFVYLGLGGQVGSQIETVSALPALVIAGLAYYVINTFLISAAMALEQQHGFWELHRSNYQWLTLNMASMIPLALGLALVYNHVGLVGLFLFMLPLTMAWYSFRLYSKSVDDVRKANQDLKTANERVNVMYEVSRALSGSLHLGATLQCIMSSIKLMGFQNGYIVGPISEYRAVRPNRRATDPSSVESLFTYHNAETERTLMEFTISVVEKHQLDSGELLILRPAEQRILVSETGTPSTLVLVPLYQADGLWGVIGIESSQAVSDDVQKELLLFRSMSESALRVALDYERTQREAMIDIRTGLFNHRYFQDALQSELHSATHRNSALSFMMVDINNFKVFNDTYGHQVGDCVLGVIGRLLRENIREEDIACRYGGDELCVLLPYADRNRAMEIAARIDRAISDFVFEAHPADDSGVRELEQLHMRVSIGVATYPQSASTPAGLIDIADRGCYRAKSLGGGVAAEEEKKPAKIHSGLLQLVK